MHDEQVALQLHHGARGRGQENGSVQGLVLQRAQLLVHVSISIYMYAYFYACICLSTYIHMFHINKHTPPLLKNNPLKTFRIGFPRSLDSQFLELLLQTLGPQSRLQFKPLIFIISVKQNLCLHYFISPLTFPNPAQELVKYKHIPNCSSV